MHSLIECSAILDGNVEYAKQLEDWLDDKAFVWKLCYRASVDGWQAENFHKKCNDVGSTIMLVKCGTNVFGGYTDRSWEGIDQIYATISYQTTVCKLYEILPPHISFSLGKLNNIYRKPDIMRKYTNQCFRKYFLITFVHGVLYFAQGS